MLANEWSFRDGPIRYVYVSYGIAYANALWIDRGITITDMADGRGRKQTTHTHTHTPRPNK